MTIQAQHPHRVTPPPEAAEPPTASQLAHQSQIVDALALLDHRTRARTIPAAGAPPGRYLAAERDSLDHLIPLHQQIIHVGRGLSADVRIEDSLISRRHAIIAQYKDGVRILDDRSSNGTFVNDREVSVTHLRDGDVLRVGAVTMRFIEIHPAFKALPVQRIPLRLISRRRVLAGAA